MQARISSESSSTVLLYQFSGSPWLFVEATICTYVGNDLNLML